MLLFQKNVTERTFFPKTTVPWLDQFIDRIVFNKFRMVRTCTTQFKNSVVQISGISLGIGQSYAYDGASAT